MTFFGPGAVSVFIVMTVTIAESISMDSISVASLIIYHMPAVHDQGDRASP
jgi:hypothetical protein